MKDYVIVTDSCGDLSPELVQDMGVVVLPLSFTLDNKNYADYPDNREYPAKDFYAKLRAGSMSSTSQVNVVEFEDALRPTLSQGKDVLVLAFSSGLSGTANNGRLAAEGLQSEYPEQTIIVVDTLGASMGEGLTVWYAVQQKNAGKTIEETAQWVEDNKLNIAHWFTVDDLNFLKRGGRLSGAAAVFGTILSIKPVLHVDNEGHLIAMEKVRGRKASLNALVEHFGKTAVNKEDGMVFISHGDCLEDCEYVRDQLHEKYGVKNFRLNTIGPVIGSHAGPGTVALFYMAEHRD